MESLTEFVVIGRNEALAKKLPRRQFSFCVINIYYFHYYCVCEMHSFAINKIPSGAGVWTPKCRSQRCDLCKRCKSASMTRRQLQTIERIKIKNNEWRRRQRRNGNAKKFDEGNGRCGTHTQVRHRLASAFYFTF